MGGVGSGAKAFKIKPEQREGILRRLEAGDTYQSVAKKYGVSPQWIHQTSVRLGKPSDWKRQKQEKDYQQKKSLVLKRLSENPNIKQVLKEFGLSQARFHRDGIKLAKTEGYLNAIDRCRDCRVQLKGYRWLTLKFCHQCGNRRHAVKMRTYFKRQRQADPEFRKRK